MVSSLQFCKAKDTELAWIDGVLDMRVEKVDTGVITEMGDAKEETEDGEPVMDVTPDLTTEPSAVANQRALKTLFGEDDREISEESDVIPTLEPLPAHEVRETQQILHRRRFSTALFVSVDDVEQKTSFKNRVIKIHISKDYLTKN